MLFRSELKNYQNFEISNFDKITKGVIKPCSRIQSIVSSATGIKDEDEENDNNIKEDENAEQDNKENDKEKQDEYQEQEQGDEQEENENESENLVEKN